jgi:hypothetical protein
MKRPIVVLLALTPIALLGFAAVAQAETTSTRAAPKVYRDAVGDAKGGPDFKSLTISDTGGVITLVLNVGLKTPAAGAPIPLAYTLFDTNGDNRAEYVFEVAESPTATNWCLMKGAAKSKCISSRTVQFSGKGSTYTLRAASADLGGATAFDFWVVTDTVTKAGKWTQSDKSPAKWSYRLQSVKLLLGTPLLKPTTPVAGQLFTITVPVTRSDGVQLPGGKSTRATASLPTLDGETLIPDDLNLQWKNGGIWVSFTLPDDAAGKLLKLTVSAMSGQMGLGMPGVSTFTLNAEHTFSFTVAPAL